MRARITAQAKACEAETKRLKKFETGMASRKRAFFRTHRSAKARRAFVKKQRKKLQTLRRARARCLRPNAPPPPASPPPASPPPDTTPPGLVIESPAAGTWFDVPLASLRGRASDAASVDCAGRTAALAGDRFTCEVPLAEGLNPITVTAADAAGNSATRLGHRPPRSRAAGRR